MQKNEIIFKHIELDESISPEFIEEMHKLVAKWIFEAWRTWKESGEQINCNVPTKPLTEDEFRCALMKVVSARLLGPQNEK